MLPSAILSSSQGAGRTMSGESVEPEENQRTLKHLQKTKEGGESLKSISLAISVLALLVAIVTVLGHRSQTEAMPAQSRADDHWSSKRM